MLPAIGSPSLSRSAVRAARILLWITLIALALAASGCGGGKKPIVRQIPNPPEPEASSRPAPRPAPSAAKPAPAKPSAAITAIHVDPNGKAIWTQEGWASWYGPNYHNKKGANGEIYDQNGMTAAHNTLPLNSVVRVVNLKTGRKAIVRITDRGPFVGDRIIDLSVAAAKVLDVYLPGTAHVRLDVLTAPHPIESGGRWCVQIGAFSSEDASDSMKSHLLKHYPGSEVLHFKGPTGWWVRIRVASDDKKKTQEVYEHTKSKEGGVFMVRLD